VLYAQNFDFICVHFITLFIPPIIFYSNCEYIFLLWVYAQQQQVVADRGEGNVTVLTALHCKAVSVQ
jgi:hypothetical protein